MRINATKISALSACPSDSTKSLPRRVLLRPECRRPKSSAWSSSCSVAVSYRLHILILKLIKQALNQISVYFDDLDPAANIHNANLYLLRSCATVAQLQMPHVLQAHSLLTGGAVSPARAAHFDDVELVLLLAGLFWEGEAGSKVTGCAASLSLCVPPGLGNEHGEPLNHKHSP